MGRKIFDRRGYIGITRSRYKQAEVKNDDFHGIVGLLYIDEVTPLPDNFRPMFADRRWLHIMPFGENYVIAAMVSADGVIINWYIDIISGYGYLPDGVLYFDDLKLDYFVENGSYEQLDMDELDEALETGDITRELYDTAVNAGQRLETNILNDLDKFNAWCMKLLEVFYET